MNSISVKPGLYRHFKGQYYCVTGISKSALDEKTFMVSYFNVCHPEYGNFVRPVEDFVADHDTCEQFGDEMTLYIKDRFDNVTGQTYRFERVEDLSFQVSSISTEQLMRELTKRQDSPIRDLDLPGAESEVFMRDYVCGVPLKDEVHGYYLVNWVQFDDETEAWKYVQKHSLPGKIVKVFKRILLEQKR